jgi:hypothetical protein
LRPKNELEENPLHILKNSSDLQSQASSMGLSKEGHDMLMHELPLSGVVGIFGVPHTDVQDPTGVDGGRAREGEIGPSPMSTEPHVHTTRSSGSEALSQSVPTDEVEASPDSGVDEEATLCSRASTPSLPWLCFGGATPHFASHDFLTKATKDQQDFDQICTGKMSEDSRIVLCWDTAAPGMLTARENFLHAELGTSKTAKDGGGIFSHVPLYDDSDVAPSRSGPEGICSDSDRTSKDGGDVLCMPRDSPVPTTYGGWRRMTSNSDSGRQANDHDNLMRLYLERRSSPT